MSLNNIKYYFLNITQLKIKKLIFFNFTRLDVVQYI